MSHETPTVMGGSRFYLTERDPKTKKTVVLHLEILSTETSSILTPIYQEVTLKITEKSAIQNI